MKLKCPDCGKSEEFTVWVETEICMNGDGEEIDSSISKHIANTSDCMCSSCDCEEKFEKFMVKEVNRAI